MREQTSLARLGEMAAVIVRHVGKLYNPVASRIAVAVSKSVEHVVDAECVLVSSARCSTRGGSIRLGTAPARRVRVRR